LSEFFQQRTITDDPFNLKIGGKKHGTLTQEYNISYRAETGFRKIIVEIAKRKKRCLI
jgi:hypothetical protein